MSLHVETCGAGENLVLLHGWGMHGGEWGGVAWFNDSKATTPHAASAAIRSFDRIILIAGGYDKGVDLSSMAAYPDRVATLIANGATGPRLADAFRRAGGAGSVELVADLAEAVALADDIARPGDTVLLSPGCASFDQHANFEARGDHFRTLVTELDRHRDPAGGHREPAPAASNPKDVSS